MSSSDENERADRAHVHCIHTRPHCIHSFPMDIQILELMDQELKSEIVAKAQTYEIFVLLGQVWTEYMQKYFTRAKKYIKFLPKSRIMIESLFCLAGFVLSLKSTMFISQLNLALTLIWKMIMLGSLVLRSHQLQCTRTRNKVFLSF